VFSQLGPQTKVSPGTCHPTPLSQQSKPQGTGPRHRPHQNMGWAVADSGQRLQPPVSHPARLWRGGDFNLNVLLGLQQALANGAIELLRGGRSNSLR
jgi:hypothetical protein